MNLYLILSGSFIQTWAGQYYKDVNYLKIQKKFCFQLVSSHFRIWMGFYHKNSHELKQRFIMHSGFRQESI